VFKAFSRDISSPICFKLFWIKAIIYFNDNFIYFASEEKSSLALLSIKKIIFFCEQQQKMRIYFVCILLSILVNLLSLADATTCPTLTVMNGVKKVQMNGCPLQVPIYDIAYEATENRLFAIGFGGLVYQIDADTMNVTNSAVINAVPYYAQAGISIFVSDSLNQVYVTCEYAIPRNLYAIAFMINSNNLTLISTYTPSSFTENPSTQTVVVYDPNGTRMFFCYLEPTGNYIRIDEVQLSGNTFTFVKYVYINSNIVDIPFGYYSSGNLNYWAYESDTFVWSNIIYAFKNYSSYVNTEEILSNGIIAVYNGQPYSTGPVSPPFKGVISGPGGNSKYIPQKTFYLSVNYTYVIYLSSIDGTSAIVQFTPPIQTDFVIPRTLLQFPNDSDFSAVFVDELMQVLFIGTGKGQVKKYAYTDSGYIVLNSTYNANNNLIDEAAPNLDSQVVDLTKNHIFYASSDDNGGVWMMPLSACEYQTSCNDCISLGDPYCGWCSLSDSCTIQSTCATHSLTNGWSQSTCPSIINFSNTTFPASVSSSIVISTSLIPNPGGSASNWTCTFTRQSGVNSTTTVASDNLVAQTFDCTIPAFLPPLSNGFNETLAVSLSYLNNTVVSRPNALTLYDCNNFKTCSSCQQAFNAYQCGWCILEGQCTLESLCDNSNSSWLIDECPTINSVFPSVYPVGIPNNVTINLAPAPLADSYICIFDTGQNATSLVVFPDDDGVIIECTMPALDVGVSVYQYVDVSIAYNGLLIASGNNQSNFTIYDCSFQTTCETCVVQAFNGSFAVPPCGWNSTTNKCEIFSLGDVTPPASNCPQITGLTPSLIVSSPSSTLTVTSANLTAPTLNMPLVCSFTLGDVIQTTNATFISSTSLQCPTPVYFSNPTSGYTSGVSVSVTRGNQLVTPNFSASGNNLTFLTCLFFSGSCQTCLEQAPLCGWCANTSSCMSSSSNNCPAGDFNTTNCPSAPPPPPPIITTLSPTTGPEAGGTILRIQGFYLGNSASDVQSITYLGDNLCLTIGWINSSTILCTTVFHAPDTANVTIQVNNQTATSSILFTYIFNPSITSFSPITSLVTGGTVVTVNGTGFASGTSLGLNIGPAPCTIQTYTDTTLTCITTPYGDTDEVFQLTVIVDSAEITFETENFTYQALPYVSAVTPISGSFSSESRVTILGENLIANISGDPLVIIVQNQTVDPIGVHHDQIFFDMPNIHSSSRKRSIQVPFNAVITIVYGNGFNFTVPFIFTVYPNPEIINVTAPTTLTTQQVGAGTSLFIVGGDLNSGLGPNVLVERGLIITTTCIITAYANNLVVCVIDPNSTYVAQTGDQVILSLGGNSTTSFDVPLFGTLNGNGTTPTSAIVSESNNPAPWLLPIMVIATGALIMVIGGFIYYYNMPRIYQRLF